MPLMVRDHTWTQNNNTVFINVPLKGVKCSKADVICTDEYLKISFPPFLFELFLFAHIDEEKSEARIGNGVAHFSLPKRRHEEWEQLSAVVDKEKQKQLREEAIVKVQEKYAEKSKTRECKVKEEKNYALETIMKMESDAQDRIQQMKKEECEKALAELKTYTNSVKHIPTPSTPVSTTARNSSKVNVKTLPAPRSSGCIQISFTPRVFPTPLRESLVQQEEEWLKKQAEARRAVDADAAMLDHLSEEERNPDWLKEKADKFFEAENYLGALNAYNLAIQLNNKMPELFSDRAACHLKMRNLHKALEDSSRALELLTPAVAANAKARLKTHVRRGMAFCQLHLFSEGLLDYQAALRIEPDNAALKVEVDNILQKIHNTTST